MKDIEAAIRGIPDFPKPGILFRDITPVLLDPKLFIRVITALADRYRDRGIAKILGVESRGFIFGAPLAVAIGAGLVPLRKPGKLPYRTIGETFELEYGTDRLEMHEDAVSDGERVLLVDDLLATGGTAAASIRLARRAGGDIVEAAFVVELAGLAGRERLQGVDTFSLVTFA